MEELFLRGIAVDQKELITKLKEHLMRNEHPGDGNSWKQQKHFKPKLLTAPDRSRDVVEVTLDKLSTLRSSRVEK